MSPELRTKIGDHLRKLRAADSQAAAVTWMTQAYKLFERCLEEIDRPEAPPRLVFMPPQIIEVVKEVPKEITKYMVPGPGGKLIPYKPPRVQTWFTAETIVYPEAPMPPPKPKPWTHRDTVRLEAAAKKQVSQLQRGGR